MKTLQALRLLTIASSSLGALAAGLAMLPIASSELPLPSEWRPYLASVGFIAIALRIVVIPTLDSAIKIIKDTEL